MSGAAHPKARRLIKEDVNPQKYLYEDLNFNNGGVILWVTILFKLFIVIIHASPFRAYLLTYSVGQSPPREANRFSASQEIRRILWDPNLHYRSH